MRIVDTDRRRPSARRAAPAARRLPAAPRDRSSGSCARWPCVWVAKGLFAWAMVLGLQPALRRFRRCCRRRCRRRSCFFAVSDLLAAVGLWLAAPWGGVLWLICAAIEAICADAAAAAPALLGPCRRRRSTSTLIAVYFALTGAPTKERAGRTRWAALSDSPNTSRRAPALVNEFSKVNNALDSESSLPKQGNSRIHPDF